jgi:hypothetical protein
VPRLVVFRETQAFSRNVIKPPISSAVTGPGNSSVFRHAVLRAGFSYVLAECGLRLPERTKRPEIGDRIRTNCGTELCTWQSRARRGRLAIRASDEAEAASTIVIIECVAV